MPLSYYENNPWRAAAAQAQGANMGITSLIGQMAANQLEQRRWADQMMLRQMELQQRQQELGIQNRLYQSHMGLYNAQTANQLSEQQQRDRLGELARSVGRAKMAMALPQGGIEEGPINYGEPTRLNAARLAPADLQASLMEMAASHPQSAANLLMHNVPPGNIAGNVMGQTVLENPEPVHVSGNSAVYMPDGRVRLGPIQTAYGAQTTLPGGQVISNERQPGDIANSSTVAAMLKGVADGTLSEDALAAEPSIGPEKARAIMANLGNIMATLGQTRTGANAAPLAGAVGQKPSIDAARKEALGLIKTNPDKAAAIKKRFQDTFGQAL